MSSPALYHFGRVPNVPRWRAGSERKFFRSVCVPCPSKTRQIAPKFYRVGSSSCPPSLPPCRRSSARPGDIQATRKGHFNGAFGKHLQERSRRFGITLSNLLVFFIPIFCPKARAFFAPVFPRFLIIGFRLNWFPGSRGRSRKIPPAGARGSRSPVRSFTRRRTRGRGKTPLTSPSKGKAAALEVRPSGSPKRSGTDQRSEEAGKRKYKALRGR